MGAKQAYIAGQPKTGKGDGAVQKLHHGARAGVLGDAIRSRTRVQRDLPDFIAPRQGSGGENQQQEVVRHAGKLNRKGASSPANKSFRGGGPAPGIRLDPPHTGGMSVIPR